MSDFSYVQVQPNNHSGTVARGNSQCSTGMWRAGGKLEISTHITFAHLADWSCCRDIRFLTHRTRTRSAHEHANPPLRTSRSARVVRARLIWQEYNMSVRGDPGSTSLAPRAPPRRPPRATSSVDRARVFVSNAFVSAARKDRRRSRPLTLSPAALSCRCRGARPKRSRGRTSSISARSAGSTRECTR